MCPTLFTETWHSHFLIRMGDSLNGRGCLIGFTFFIKLKRLIGYRSDLAEKIFSQESRLELLNGWFLNPWKSRKPLKQNGPTRNSWWIFTPRKRKEFPLGFAGVFETIQTIRWQKDFEEMIFSKTLPTNPWSIPLPVISEDSLHDHLGVWTNISPKNCILSRWFSELPFRWDMLIPWRVALWQSRVVYGVFRSTSRS